MDVCPGSRVLGKYRFVDVVRVFSFRVASLLGDSYVFSHYEKVYGLIDVLSHESNYACSSSVSFVLFCALCVLDLPPLCLLPLCCTTIPSVSPPSSPCAPPYPYCVCCRCVYRADSVRVEYTIAVGFVPSSQCSLVCFAQSPCGFHDMIRLRRTSERDTACRTNPSPHLSTAFSQK